MRGLRAFRGITACFSWLQQVKGQVRFFRDRPTVHTIGNLKQKIAILLQDFQKQYQFDKIFTTKRTIVEDQVQQLSCAVITKDEYLTSGPVQVNVLERIGTGDSFVAGVLFGLNQSFTLQETLDFALSSFALKHTIVGDFQISSKQEVQSFDLSGEKVIIKR